jgi:hypothetical protein
MARAARRVAAILDADVVDHSRLMQTHEGRWATIAVAGGVLAAIVIYLASASALAGLGMPDVQSIERLQLERRAVAAFSRWLQASARNGGELDEADDQPANPANAPPADAYDGLYAGAATTKADSHVVTFKVKVTGGIGSGTQSRPDCGTAPVALKVSPSGWRWSSVRPAARRSWPSGGARSPGRCSSGSAANTWNCRRPTDAACGAWRHSHRTV